MYAYALSGLLVSFFALLVSLSPFSQSEGALCQLGFGATRPLDGAHFPAHQGAGRGERSGAYIFSRAKKWCGSQLQKDGELYPYGCYLNVLCLLF